MIKLRSHPAASASAPALSPNLSVLAVSWLNGRFTAAAVVRGTVVGRWVCTDTHESVVELPRLLREAVTRTAYDGATVQLTLAHPRLNQLWLEVPETGGVAVQRFLQRQAQQGKSFDGAAVFSSQPTIASKLSKGLLLHLAPQELIEQLEKLTEAAGLILTAVLPVAVLAQRQLSQLPLGDGDLGVLAVELGGQTLLVVGRANGELCLARTLNEGWSRNAARFAAEVNRTVHFVSQQFAFSPSSVWLFGGIAPERLAELQGELARPVALSPVPLADDWWANELLHCSPNHPANLISRDRQAEPRRRRMLSVTLATVAALILVAAGVTLRFHLLRLQGQREAGKVRQSIAQLTQRFQALASRQTELTNYQIFIKEAVDGRPPPVPAWFLGHLSEAVGPDLVVTNLHVQAAGSHWQMAVAGYLPGERGSVDTNRLTAALGSLTNQLANGPFHVRFGTNAAPASATASVGALNAISHYWTKRGSTVAARGPVNGDFRVEGRFP